MIKKLLIVLMMLITSSLYSQGSLGYTIEEVNKELKEFGLPEAIQDTDPEYPEIWICQGYDGYGKYCTIWFWVDEDLDVVSRTLITLNTLEDFNKQKKNINKKKHWIHTIKSKDYNQWVTPGDDFDIYVNTFKECLQIEYLLDFEQDEVNIDANEEERLIQFLLEQYLLEEE